MSTELRVPTAHLCRPAAQRRAAAAEAETTHGSIAVGGALRRRWVR